MSTPNHQNLTVSEAKKILNKFNCLDIAPILKPSEKVLVRRALILVSRLSDYQILGICADTAEEGILAMRTYSHAFGYEVPTNLPTPEGSVYIKLNGKNGLCYLDSYAGHHRGVLISCQSYNEGGINEMYGHLPLDLFV
ncbi:DUF1824 family protein [Umezakia ovalisporum]|jgi:hypothetical protein|uniref:DUF1824 family protein n=2 Tax=Umezakia ovalisporum TaxID=75695 RepID=A0AA43GZ66_9CYAN|nr:DUF1824 family protein [Umezakia ovalisporum]MBI1242143.1 DUF1824 family protein [Nostoc sp. RI_552]MDH6056304.1 DUF1824 family protein [Umezakia ovalisporum FSS-43]MDH6064312.1 DUF1824 family protein [Umezakia ovalisporum FSS-62]MDH6068857.1 DUF1824 family protein [Umezakia ovalisporum APH033B]MDH6071013.1 DUF1824 family protein [Umezakia ovalisporum CobakiLakeA]